MPNKKELKIKTTGRPTKYSPEMVDLICERIAKHPWGLERICNHYDDMPCKDTIFAWLAKHDSFSDRYLIAKAKQTHVIAEDLSNTPQELQNYIYIDPVSGAQKIDSGIIAMFNLKHQTAKWTNARLNTKVYGERQTVVTTNSEDEDKKQELKEMRAKLKEKEKSDY